MLIINIFLLSIYIILLFSNFFIDTHTLGEIWKNTHINSLIGLQKVIENWELKKDLNFEIWYNLILPILEVPILFFFTIIITLILVIILLRLR